MNPSSTFDIRRVLILKAELIYAEALAITARTAFPNADIRHANTVNAARDSLSTGPLDLLVTDLSLADGEMLDFLFLAMAERPTIKHVLVATARRDLRTLHALAHLPLDGIFDAGSGTLAQFGEALHAVANAKGYWSRSLELGSAVRVSAPVARFLTPVEQLVLSVIGDGCDDSDAAALLGVKQSSVHSVRRDLHRKLGARHKGELIRQAVLHGYVRFTDKGVDRPGYAMLLADCTRRRSVKGPAGCNAIKFEAAAFVAA